MGAIEPKLPVAIGDLVGGKYVVESLIGSGGMGVIAAARHVQLDQRVALKFLHSHVVSNEQAVARFMREAKSTVRLKSDHVARVFDVDTLATGEPYAVMELLEGVDLANYARSNGPLRIPDAVEFVVQACEGIVEAHALGIVHRDLKPQNLFVTRRLNGSPRIKVLDFGISKSLGGADLSLTDSTVVLGSPLYMSPEQMKASRTVDVRSDVWALGVILYELLTGGVPFDGESITELCLKVVTAEPRAPREMRADIPEPLAAAVVRCLEKDPANRFPSVAALAEALEPYSAGAERGATDRSWRSLAETADAFRVASHSVISTPPVANTHATWDKVADAGPPSRRRGFYRGVAAGVVVSIAVASATVLSLGLGRRSEGAPPSGATQVAAAAVVAAPPTTPTQETSPSSPPTAAAEVAQPPQPAPQAAAKTRSGVDRPKTSPKGKASPKGKPDEGTSSAPVVAAGVTDAGAPSFRRSANDSPILP